MTNRLVSNYIQTLATGGEIPDAADGDAIARNLMELIALAVRANARDREACANGVASGLLLGLLQYLDTHFRHPALSPLHAASHLGISSRHVHRLCERTGTTFSEQLYERRLRAAHRLLIDPLHRHRSITDVAYDCGFHDLTHFGRRYREIYGMTPSEARGISPS